MILVPVHPRHGHLFCFVVERFGVLIRLPFAFLLFLILCLRVLLWIAISRLMDSVRLFLILGRGLSGSLVKFTGLDTARTLVVSSLTISGQV